MCKWPNCLWIGWNNDGWWRRIVSASHITSFTGNSGVFWSYNGRVSFSDPDFRGPQWPALRWLSEGSFITSGKKLPLFKRLNTALQKCFPAEAESHLKGGPIIYIPLYQVFRNIQNFHYNCSTLTVSNGNTVFPSTETLLLSSLLSFFWHGRHIRDSILAAQLNVRIEKLLRTPWILLYDFIGI